MREINMKIYSFTELSPKIQKTLIEKKIEQEEEFFWERIEEELMDNLECILSEEKIDFNYNTLKIVHYNFDNYNCFGEFRFSGNIIYEKNPICIIEDHHNGKDNSIIEFYFGDYWINENMNGKLTTEEDYQREDFPEDEPTNEFVKTMLIDFKEKYLEICSKVEKNVLKSSEISEDDVLELLMEDEYFEDGDIYS